MVRKTATRPAYFAEARRPWLSLTCAMASGLVAASLLPVPARATLGETESSVQTDSVRLKATLRVTAAGSQGAQALRVRELTQPNGTVIREFLDATGRVYAVSWRGPFKPDLPALLGSYFGTYASAPRSAGSNRSRLAIDQANLVVRAGGHQRAFIGLAYVPQLLPSGVSGADLQ